MTIYNFSNFKMIYHFNIWFFDVNGNKNITVCGTIKANNRIDYIVDVYSEDFNDLTVAENTIESIIDLIVDQKNEKALVNYNEKNGNVCCVTIYKIDDVKKVNFIEVE